MNEKEFLLFPPAPLLFQLVTLALSPLDIYVHLDHLLTSDLIDTSGYEKRPGI
jgi:hypothetical protein